MLGDRLVGVEGRVLRQIGRLGARLAEQLAAVELDEAGHDLEQGRLARAVAADQARAVAAAELQLEIGEQQLVAEADARLAERHERGRGHGYLKPRSRLTRS